MGETPMLRGTKLFPSPRVQPSVPGLPVFVHLSISADLKRKPAMRTRLATAVLAAAISGHASFSPLHAADAPPANAAAEAKEHAQIPVKQVVLYSSGVGYFEHYGTVKGTGTTELRF